MVHFSLSRRRATAIAGSTGFCAEPVVIDYKTFSRYCKVAGAPGVLRRSSQSCRAVMGRWKQCPLRLVVWPATERTEDSGGLEVRYVARHYGEPVFQRRGRDHEVGAVIAESGAQGAPTPRRRQVEWHDPLAVEGEHPVQPGRKGAGKAWISRAPSRNPALHFANADDAEEKIGRSLPFELRHDHRIALATRIPPPSEAGEKSARQRLFRPPPKCSVLARSRTRCAPAL
jgi:hypothetical protein